MPTHCVSKGQLSVPLSYPCQMGFVHVSWQLTQVISRKVRYCNACVKKPVTAMKEFQCLALFPSSMSTTSCWAYSWISVSHA